MIARLAVVVAVVAAAAGLAASGALAVLATIGLGPAAHPVTNATALWIPVKYRCTHAAFFNLRVTVFQSDVGAVARGKMHVVCSGELQHGAVKVVQGSKHPRSFKDGYARACWLAIVQKPPGTKPGGYSDLKSSCNGLTVAPKS